MKNLKGLFINTLVISFLIIASSLTHAQTAGNLTFSCSTYAPNGDWGTLHVVAIWIEDSNNNFTKTNAKYGYEDDHLTSWRTSSNSNIVDAVTGATVQTYRTESMIWNGTDINSVVVDDGTYNVFIEMGWGRDKVNDHAVVSFSFTKSAESVQVSPADETNFSDISILWEPTATAIDQKSDNNTVSMYPNPSQGIIKLDIKKSSPNSSIMVENVQGKTVYNEKLPDGFTGIQTIDLRKYGNGLYLIKLLSGNQQFVYKAIVKE